jgi:hypothetical protein
MDISKRPRPILEKFKTVGGGLAVAAGSLSSLVTLGVLHQAEADSVNGVLVAGAGLFTAVMTLLTTFGVVKSAEPLVTPVVDPRDDAGNRLVAAPGKSGLGLTGGTLPD